MNIMAELQARIGNSTSKVQQSSDETLEERAVRLATREAEKLNEIEGNLTGYDCPKCKNRGYTAVVRGKVAVTVPCECMTIRGNIARLERSGLKDSISEYRFKNYKVSEDWQKDILTKAVNYAKSPEGWFYIGGQVGAGKTHICTAIAAHLIRQGKETRYFKWVDDGVRLKALKNNDEEYNRLLEPFKIAEVLYIDDFLKTESGKAPTTADINLAFELINYRYNNRQLSTIISSEKTITDLLELDEATGSRIKQRSGENCIAIKADRTKNYRLR